MTLMYKDDSDQNARMSSLYLEEIINIKGAINSGKVPIGKKLL
jgi:hypothetical protein